MSHLGLKHVVVVLNPESVEGVLKRGQAAANETKKNKIINKPNNRHFANLAEKGVPSELGDTSRSVGGEMFPNLLPNFLQTARKSVPTSCLLTALTGRRSNGLQELNR